MNTRVARRNATPSSVATLATLAEDVAAGQVGWVRDARAGASGGANRGRGEEGAGPTGGGRNIES